MPTRSALRGALAFGTRVVWCGGAFEVQMADGAGAGTVAIPDGATLTVTNRQALGGASLLLDGSALALYEETAAERAFSTNSGAICVGPGGGTVTLSGCSPLPFRGTGRCDRIGRQSVGCRAGGQHVGRDRFGRRCPHCSTPR